MTGHALVTADGDSSEQPDGAISTRRSDGRPTPPGCDRRLRL